MAGRRGGLIISGMLEAPSTENSEYLNLSFFFDLTLDRSVSLKWYCHCQSLSGSLCCTAVHSGTLKREMFMAISSSELKRKSVSLLVKRPWILALSEWAGMCTYRCVCVCMYVHVTDTDFCRRESHLCFRPVLALCDPKEVLSTLRSSVS